MKILEVKAIEGANYYSYKPVIRVVIDISDWQGKTTKDLKEFNQLLVTSLPTLQEHNCSKGKPGGFIERLKEGTFPGHVLEHVTLELISLAGNQVRYGKTMVIPEEENQYEIIYEYECKEVAIEAIYLALDIIEKIRTEQEPHVAEAVQELRKLRSIYEAGPSTKAIIEACKQRSVPVQRLGGGSLLQLGYGRNQRRVQAAMTDQTSCIGADIAGDKQLTRKILKEASIPVPPGKVVYSEEEIINCFKEFAKPVVVKPCQGNQGKGVSLNLKTEVEVLTAYRLAEMYDRKIIIEEFIQGNNYRILIIGNKMIAAAKRIPPFVIGDGKSTIEELVENENLNTLRGEGHENYLSKISLDSIAIMDLTRQGLNLDTILDQGRKVFLRGSANLSTGGTAEDVTNKVHPDNAQLAVYTARVLGLDIAGVDLVMENISKTYLEQEGKVIEVNAAPGLRMHLRPSKGNRIDIGKAVVKQLYPLGNGRIPIVSVTGTNGKTTVVRLLSYILQKQNIKVGMTSTSGIYINGRLLAKGDCTGPQSARTVLRHPDVQVAVLETARGGVLRSGLGYDLADVAVLTNISGDHLGEYGIESLEDLAKVKSLIIEMVQKQGFVILNADDPMVGRIERFAKGRVILFSMREQNRMVCRHLGKGETAVIVDKELIKLCQGEKSQLIGRIEEIPLTWGGRARHNIQNVLAAIGAAWALGFNTEQICQGINNFDLLSSDNKGRLDYYEVNGVKVIFDYAHNPAGIREVLRTVKQIKHGKIIGCIGLPGDRTDNIVRAFAGEAARDLDLAIIKEDQDLRGRKAGEVAGIIARELIDKGFKEDQVEIVLNEVEAFKAALKKANRGDIVMVLYEELEPLEKVIEQSELKWKENFAQSVSNYNFSLEVQ